jgi:hypothetical protein
LAALLLRAGNAGSNTAADLITVLHEAITQISKRQRRRLLITCDGAGASHGLIDCAQRQNHAADRTWSTRSASTSTSTRAPRSADYPPTGGNPGWMPPPATRPSTSTLRRSPTCCASG